MERQIKFRYYFTDGKDFIVKEFDLDAIANGAPLEVLSDNPLLRSYRHLATVQWTGLKDKHGREIYEGDVIKDPGGECLVVIWNQECCEYQLDHESGSQSLTSSCVSWAEVIGDRYTSPELLTKETKS